MRSRGVTGGFAPEKLSFSGARLSRSPERFSDAPPPRSAELALSPLPGVRPPNGGGAGVRTNDALVTFAFRVFFSFFT